MQLDISIPAAMQLQAAINERIAALYRGRVVTARGSVEREIVDAAIRWSESAVLALEEALYPDLTPEQARQLVIDGETAIFAAGVVAG